MNPACLYVRKNRDLYLSHLKELLRIPSISTDPGRKKEIRLAAGWLEKRLQEAGCRKTKIHNTPGHPIVYGEWLGAPGKPTLLVYGHYDVQPVDPLELWETPPFEPTVRDEKLYARGASDDKGQVVIHINALEAYLKSTGSCPVNLKFLIEGEEEIGSPNLDPFIHAHRKMLQCDAVVVSDTAMFAKGIPSICYGLRGLAYFQIDLKGTDGDLHSGSFGGAVVNPANALVALLASLKDANGRIRIPGFYEKVRRLKPAERKGFAGLPHSDRKFKDALGAPALFGEKGYTTLERLWARPSLDVNGIWAGFTGEGAKTVIPAQAHAKISMRLVPDQTPKEIGRKVLRHLKAIAPKSVKINVTELHGGNAWLADTNHPFMAAAGKAMKGAFGRKPVLVREGGSIPVVGTFADALKVPCILLGIGLNEDNIHAPNEKIDLDQFFPGNEAAVLLLSEIGSLAEGDKKK
jgi:acetylornithine deacetylase/succinyl-diaminopimelate desuccinylase-like protein